MQLTDKLPEIGGDDRAVSPVIGVILMVAITVILAAVIGSFVLGLGDQLDSQGPQVSIGVNGQTNSTASNDTLVRINHNNGPNLQLSDLKLTIRNSSNNALIEEWPPANQDDGSVGTNLLLKLNGGNASGTFAPGDQLQVYENSASGPLASGDQVRIVIQDTSSESTIVDTTITIG